MSFRGLLCNDSINREQLLFTTGLLVSLHQGDVNISMNEEEELFDNRNFYAITFFSFIICSIHSCFIGSSFSRQ